MISSLLMHCYQFQGYGSWFISSISGTIINFLGEIYVDDTDLIVTCPNLTTAAAVHEELERSASTWAAGLNSTGGALNPEKCKWTLADYCCEGGKWKYATQPDLAIKIPLPNSDPAKISQGEVLVAEKALGIWSSIDGNNEAHVEHDVIERVEKWINRMSNGHLPAKLGWIAYRFKLWAGVRYGLSVLAAPLLILAGVLKKQNFWLLSFLGVNHNVKREWRMIHRAFGSIGLFSFAIEQTIGMINMFIQHFEASMLLTKKFTATLEALQLEKGCIGNPLLENYNNLGILATACWAKSFWERLHFYRFAIQMEYPTLHLPRRNDALIVTILQRAGCTGDDLIVVNQCPIANKMLFLSDINSVRMVRGLQSSQSNDLVARAKISIPVSLGAAIIKGLDTMEDLLDSLLGGRQSSPHPT
jgi:hypothetical protein